MENFWIVARQVWILFALIAVGAVARRMKLVDEPSCRGFVNVLLHVVTPCLIIDVFQRPFDSGLLRQFGIAFAIAFLAHLALIFLSRLTVRGSDASVTTVLRAATVFSNAGFMGIPLEQAILGDKGVFFGIVYVAMFNLFMWSWGLRMMSDPAGRRAAGVRAMFVNPGTVGLAVGLPLFLFSVRLPETLVIPVSMLSDMNTPLAMLMIGYYLAGAKPGATLRRPAAYVAAGVRLIAAPLLLIAALYPFRAALDREMMLALVTPASAPVGATVTMFAAKYGRDVELGVGLVSVTTLASVVTMPVVIAFAMEVLG